MCQFSDESLTQQDESLSKFPIKIISESVSQLHNPLKRSSSTTESEDVMTSENQEKKCAKLTSDINELKSPNPVKELAADSKINDSGDYNAQQTSDQKIKLLEQENRQMKIFLLNSFIDALCLYSELLLAGLDGATENAILIIESRSPHFNKSTNDFATRIFSIWKIFSNTTQLNVFV